MSGNGVRVLFVDDEPSIRMTLSAILERAGFQVTVAATVPEALDHMGKEKFDLLLSDLNIGQPGDGFTVISAMRRSQPEVATIILTGFPDFDTALQALRSQVDDYLTKPADVKKLLSVLNENLRKPKRHTPVQVKRVSTVLRENANQDEECEPKHMEAVSYLSDSFQFTFRSETTMSGRLRYNSGSPAWYHDPRSCSFQFRKRFPPCSRKSYAN